MQTPSPGARYARRKANEQAAVVLLAAEVRTDVMTVQCECGSDDCEAEITLQREAFRNIRLKGTLFVVRRGHEDTSAPVVSRNDEFSIVTVD
jgi:hypothetical protein